MREGTISRKIPKDVPSVEEILALCKRLDTAAKPKEADIAEMKRLLAEIPNLWQWMGELAVNNEQKLIEEITKQPTTRLCIQAGCNVIREGLGYKDAPIMEQMLIKQIVLCWLRLQFMEFNLTHATNNHAPFYEKRVSAAQRRFLRACEALGRIRKMDISLQVNVAMNGGQQVNQVSG